MITINLFNDGFEISGHADSNEPGKDLVCAGISAISQGIINCFPKKDIKQLEINKDLGIIKFRLKSVDERTKVILETFKNQVLTVQTSNKKYLKIIE